MIFIQDKDFTIIQVNKAFADAMKLKPAEIIGRKCYELVHGTNVPWPNCPSAEAVMDKKPHTEEVIDKNIGMPLLVTASPILDDNGELIGVVHVARDISGIKKIEEDLKQRIDELEKFNKITMGREKRIIELKEEIDRLKEELAKYKKS